jgi:hypothetical protein
MNQVSEALRSTAVAHVGKAPRLSLLLRWESGPRVFLGNLFDLLTFRTVPHVRVTSKPGRFWPDVFVPSHVSWWTFMESLLWHMLAIVAIVALNPGWRQTGQFEARYSHRHSTITYYPPTYTTVASARPSPKAHSTPLTTAALQKAVDVARGGGKANALVLPPDVRMGEGQAPNLSSGAAGSIPALPLVATGTSRQLPAGPVSVVAPSPDVQGGAGRRALSGLGEGAVAPPPTVRGGTRRAGDINIGNSTVVAPAPQLPTYARSGYPGNGAANLGGTGASVVPPPPSLDRSGASGTGRADLFGPGGRMTVVPPAPTLGGAGASVARGRSVGIPGNGMQIVAPPPAIQGAGGGIPGGRGGNSFSNGMAAVPPPPSVADARGGFGGGSGSDGVGNGRGGVGFGSQVVPPSPSLQGTGGGSGSGRGLGLGGNSSDVVPPSPSVQMAANSGGGRAAAMNIPRNVPPPPPDIENPSNPAGEELPVRVLGIALSLPGSSYFANYEVFIAERRVRKTESQLIKLVYVFLPYQRRLSEVGFSEAKVFKLRVKRDPSCDETLQQMTQPRTDPNDPQPRRAPSITVFDPDSNDPLPCYRTTAEDYRKAVAHNR